MTTSDAELLAQMRERLDQIENGSGEAEQRLDELAAMGAQLKQVEATATAPDKAVVVTAGPGGTVRDIRVTEQGKRLSPTQLSALIMTTLGQALADAARKQASIVQDAVGDTDVLDRVLNTQSQIFGVPMTVDGPAGEMPPRAPDPAEPPPRRVRLNSDDDEAGFQGFERGNW